MLNRIQKNIATQKLLTENPSIKLSAKRIIHAFMTNMNSPRVKMVIGNVKMIKIGFTIRFKTDNTSATMIAVT